MATWWNAVGRGIKAIFQLSNPRESQIKFIVANYNSVGLCVMRELRKRNFIVEQFITTMQKMFSISPKDKEEHHIDV